MTTDKNRSFMILVAAYIASWVCFYLLVHHNKEAKCFSIAPSIIIMVEVIKLLFALTLFCKSKSLNEVIIPQSRKVALILITTGLILKCFKNQSSTTTNAGFLNGNSWVSVIGAASLVFLQMFCSVLASVYNETLLKVYKNNEYVQNICLYMNSIVINLVILAFFSDSDHGQLLNAFSKRNIMIVVTLAAVGLMTAIILRSAGSVTKSVVTASITIVACLIEVVFFVKKLPFSKAIDVLLVTMGSIIYSLNPDFSNQEKENTILASEGSAPQNKIPTRIKRILFLVLLLAGLNVLYYVSPEIFRKSRVSNTASYSEKKNTVCTYKIAQQHRPSNVTDDRKHEKVKGAEAVVTHIVKRFSEINAPVVLMFGTLLYEYTNGTSPCVLLNEKDKKFDIALFEPHFYALVDMGYEIQEIFGWKMHLLGMDRMLMVLYPPGQVAGDKDPFQIDAYGFKTNSPKEGFVHFPGDNVTFALDGFLPLVKHKTIAYREAEEEGNKDLYLHVPRNVSCNLKNLFGDNYTTPHGEGFSWRHDAYNQPKCVEERNMTMSEAAELDIQLKIGNSFF